VLVGELNIECLALHARAERRYGGIRRYPAVMRQLSIAVEAAVTAEQARALIAASGGDLLVEVQLADLFHLPDGKTSLSYSFLLQSDERTLTDEQANDIRDRIMAALHAQLGATQR